MKRPIFAVLAIGLLLTAACAGLNPGPTSDVQPIAAPSMEQALRATVVAATSLNWVPKTISAEAGYVMAERGLPLDFFRLEVMIPPGGKGPMSVKVTPYSSDITQESSSSMVAKFREAFQKAIVARSETGP